MEPVTARVVADEFDVTVSVAGLALRRVQASLLEAEMTRSVHRPVHRTARNGSQLDAETDPAG